MRGKIVEDWTKVTPESLSDPTTRKKVFAAVQHFLAQPNSPEVRKTLQARVQNWATTGDFPTSVLEVLKEFQLTTYYDTTFEAAFDMVDMSNSNRNGFELLDVEDGLTFNKVAEGDKAKIYKMQGTKVTVTFDMYGAGLGWSRRLFDDREYWNIENNAVAFRNKWYSSRAAVQAALIDAVGAAQNLAWQAPVPALLPNTDANYAAIRDINTINQACVEIVTDLADKGMGVTPSSAFVLLCPIQLVPRIRRALGLLNYGLSGSLPSLVYNVTVYPTAMLASNSVYYVCLPKQKSIFVDRMPLTVFDQFDPQSYSDIAVGWGRYGGCIGDIEQFQRCATV